MIASACPIPSNACPSAAAEGQALLGMGQALAIMDQSAPARDALNRSIEVFARIQATVYLERAKAAVSALAE